jgi:hypothetical protein
MLAGIFSAAARRGVADTGSGSGEVFSAAVTRGIADTGSGSGEVTSPSRHFSRSPVRWLCLGRRRGGVGVAVGKKEVGGMDLDTLVDSEGIRGSWAPQRRASRGDRAHDYPEKSGFVLKDF